MEIINYKKWDKEDLTTLRQDDDDDDDDDDDEWQMIKDKCLLYSTFSSQESKIQMTRLDNTVKAKSHF